MEFESMGDEAILRELGDRLRRVRLNQNLTQTDLARQAGIGRRTLQKAEEGEVTTLETLIAILRGLGRLNQIDQFLPEPPKSPVQLARLQGKERQRASGKRKAPAADWKWEE